MSPPGASTSITSNVEARYAPIALKGVRYGIEILAGDDVFGGKLIKNFIAAVLIAVKYRRIVDVIRLNVRLSLI